MNRFGPFFADNRIYLWEGFFLLEFLQSIPYRDYLVAYSPYLYQPYLYTLVFFGQTVIICLGLFLTNRLYDRYIYRAFGWRALLVVSWLGTIIHEVSHALVAKLFGHRIKKFKPFSPHKASGSLGMVQNSWIRPTNFMVRYYREVAGNIFIAMAPFVGGTLCIYLLVKLLFPQYVPVEAVEQGVGWINLVEHPDWGTAHRLWQEIKLFTFPIARSVMNREFLNQWPFYVMLYLLLSISSGIGPSSTDFRVLRSYLWRFLAAFWIFGWIAYGSFIGVAKFARRLGWVADPPELLFAKMITFTNGILFFALLISLTFLIVIFLLAQLKIKLFGVSKDFR